MCKQSIRDALAKVPITHGHASQTGAKASPMIPQTIKTRGWLHHHSNGLILHGLLDWSIGPQLDTFRTLRRPPHARHRLSYSRPIAQLQPAVYQGDYLYKPSCGNFLMLLARNPTSVHSAPLFGTFKPPRCSFTILPPSLTSCSPREMVTSCFLASWEVSRDLIEHGES